MSLPKKVDPTGRYFINDALDITDPDLLQTISSPREYLIASLTDLVTTCPPKLPWSGSFAKGQLYCGIFAGPTSVAFLFLWLSKLHPELLIDGKSPSDYCTEYLNLGQDKYGPEETQRSGCSLNHEYMCYNAVKACHTKNLSYVHKFIENLDKLTLRPTFIEVLFGKAGLLSLMRTIKYWVPESKTLLDPEIDKTIEYCLSYDPWTFGLHADSQARYIGAGHGDISIISNIVMSNPDYAAKVQGRLEIVLNLQTEQGNWLSREGGGNDLVQWCHGAPGIIWCLVPIRRYFPELHERIDAAVSKARRVVWERGLLTKEQCLCHGITGNAFALAEPQRSHFLQYATPEAVKAGLADGILEKSSDNCGVWWSEAGRAWGWMMLEYEKTGQGDSLVGIGYPGATNP
ncbi:hypothetical protein AA313_de0201641 [Arthrobotrys entomopaga]|nr:hypothetical protein AA313_de0201641 [Arthrobotrys entomopaga]